MKIYYAHSIKGNHMDNERSPLDIIAQITSLGHEVLSEEIWTSIEQLSDQHIYERDIKMIDGCDVVLANVSNPSLGVGYEIAYAESINKPIICFCQKDITLSISSMITGHFSVSYITKISDLTLLKIS